MQGMHFHGCQNVGNYICVELVCEMLPFLGRKPRSGVLRRTEEGSRKESSLARSTTID